MGDKGGIALSIGASVCIVIVVVTAIALYFTGIIKLPDLSVALGGKAADKTAEKKDIWSDWTTGECSKPCGTGTRTKTRTCITPADGVGCIGEATKTEPCNLSPCDVYSDWIPGACSKECGTGTRTKTRTCVTPGDGVNCKGDVTKTEPCNTFPCAAGWGAWVNGTCSTKCGPGTIKRTRVCVNPALGCEGPAETSDECNLGPCPIDGIWSDWKSTGACTQDCGGGEITQTRTCTVPQNGGKPCEGPSERKIECNTERCFTKMEILQTRKGVPIDLAEIKFTDAAQKRIDNTGMKVWTGTSPGGVDYPQGNVIDNNDDTFMQTDSDQSQQEASITFPRPLKIAFIDVVAKRGSEERAQGLEFKLYKPNGKYETLKIYPEFAGTFLKNTWSFALTPTGKYHWILLDNMAGINYKEAIYKYENTIGTAVRGLLACEKDDSCFGATLGPPPLYTTYIGDGNFTSKFRETSFLRSDQIDKAITSKLRAQCTTPGSFNENCLDVLWKGVGCTTDVKTTGTVPGKSWQTQLDWYNARSRDEVLTDMKEWLVDRSYRGQACTGKEPVVFGPCRGQTDAPLSTECLNDIWAKAGCLSTIPSDYSGWWKTQPRHIVESDMSKYKSSSKCTSYFTT